MGIGRREFLKLFGAALAATAVSASPAAALLDDLYINRKLGIAFRKFPGWHFANIMDLGEIKNGQILALDDLELAKKVKDMSELPLITVSKEPITVGSRYFSPGFNVYLEKYIKSGNDDPQDPDVKIQKDIDYCNKILKEFNILSEPTTYSVSNCRSIQYISSFLFEHVDLIRSTPVRMDTLLILQQPAWYLLRMYDSPYLGPEYTVDYSLFIDTIKLV